MNYKMENQNNNNLNKDSNSPQTQNNKNDSPTKLNKSLWVKEFFCNKDKIKNEIKMKYTTLGSLLEEKDQIREEIKNLIERELLRVSNEFITKNYSRKFNCTQKEVFSTIIGSDKATQECSKLKRDIKVRLNEGD